MGLPDAKKTKIPKAKIVGYLLSSTHPAGRSKAAFFRKHGFAENKWQALRDALRVHAQRGDLVTTEVTQHGTRYVVDGTIAAPDGTFLNVRSVWFIRRSESSPTLATAHPLRRTEP